MQVSEGQFVDYVESNGRVVAARVFRKCGGKLWLDHRTFSRARVVGIDSAKLTGRVRCQGEIES